MFLCLRVQKKTIKHACVVGCCCNAQARPCQWNRTKITVRLSCTASQAGKKPQTRRENQARLSERAANTSASCRGPRCHVCRLPAPARRTLFDSLEKSECRITISTMLRLRMGLRLGQIPLTTDKTRRKADDFERLLFLAPWMKSCKLPLSAPEACRSFFILKPSKGPDALPGQEGQVCASPAPRRSGEAMLHRSACCTPSCPNISTPCLVILHHVCDAITHQRHEHVRPATLPEHGPTLLSCMVQHWERREVLSSSTHLTSGVATRSPLPVTACQFARNSEVL